MRAWKALGVVETIYEEEPFEDTNSSSSFLSPSHSSHLSPLHSRIQSWSQVTGRNPDVVIHVQGTCFHLHKDPLTSKSIYLRLHLTTESELNLSPPLNITAETFALVSEFSYGVPILLTPFNVAALRTAAELLDMAEPCDDGDEGNLWQFTESYFRQAVGVNRDYACIVLRSCLALLPEAETTASLVSRCVETLGLTSDGHGVDGLFEDVKTVRPDDFRAVAESMHRRLTRHDLLYWIVDYYLKEHEGELTDEQKTQICNSIDCNKVSPRLLIHALQNQVLPLRFLVRAMLVEQLNTRRSLFSATNHHSRQTGPPPPQEHSRHGDIEDDVPITLGAILQREASMRLVAQLKAEMETTATRIQSLERELSDMKGLCLLQYECDENANPRNSIVDSGRSASFHYGTTAESKIKRGEGDFNSSSCRFSDSRDVAGSSSSESPRVQKNIRQRLIHGLKSAFRVSKSGVKHHGSESKGKVGGEEESESIVVIVGHRRGQSTV